VPSTILSDNGVTSGSAGLKTTAASDGALALQTTTAGGVATTALSISTAQVVTLTNALPVASGGTGSTSTTFVNLTTNVTGTLPIANGGTNSTATATAGGIGYGTGTANAYTAAGTTGQALLSNGASAPTWGDVAAFASGTKMLFVQTAAPTGWTKDTVNNNNKALRIVTGTASTGGSVAFTTAFASQTPAGSVSVSGGSVSATTLSTSQIPSHQHSLGLWRPNVPDVFQGGYTTPGNRSCPWFGTGGPSSNPYLGYSENAGGGGSHDHGFTTPTASFSGTAINLAVQYVDVIVATKD
jgi:hypothetical protein